jgi:hypothetical protein
LKISEIIVDIKQKGQVVIPGFNSFKGLTIDLIEKDVPDCGPNHFLFKKSFHTKAADENLQLP